MCLLRFGMLPPESGFTNVALAGTAIRALICRPSNIEFTRPHCGHANRANWAKPGLGRRTWIKRRYDQLTGDLAKWIVRLFECEGSFANTMLAQVFQPFFRLIYSWNVSCFYPPERHVDSFKFLKPLPATTHYLRMRALVYICFE